MAGEPTGGSRSSVSLPLTVNANTDRIYEDVKKIQGVVLEEDQIDARNTEGGVTPQGKYEHISNSGIEKDKAITNLQSKQFIGTGSATSRYVGKDGREYIYDADGSSSFSGTGTSPFTVLNGNTFPIPSGASLIVGLNGEPYYYLGPGGGAYAGDGIAPFPLTDGQVYITDFISTKYNNVVPITDGFMGIRKNSFILDKLDDEGNVVTSRTVSITGMTTDNTTYLAYFPSLKEFTDTAVIYQVSANGDLTISVNESTIGGTYTFASTTLGGVAYYPPYRNGALAVAYTNGYVFFGFNGNNRLESVGLWWNGSAFVEISATTIFDRYQAASSSTVLGLFYYHLVETTGDFYIVITTDCGTISPTTAASSGTNRMTTGLESSFSTSFTVVTTATVGITNGSTVTSEAAATVGYSDLLIHKAVGPVLKVYNNGVAATTSTNVLSTLYPCELDVNAEYTLAPISSNNVINGYRLYGKRLGIDIGDTNIFGCPVYSPRGTIGRGAVKTASGVMYLFVGYPRGQTYIDKVRWYEYENVIKTNVSTAYVFNKKDQYIQKDLSFWNGKGLATYIAANTFGPLVAVEPIDHSGLGYIDVGEFTTNGNTNILLYNSEVPLKVFYSSAYKYSSAFKGAGTSISYYDESFADSVYTTNQTIPTPGLMNYSQIAGSTLTSSYVLGGFEGTVFNRAIDGFVIGNSVAFASDTFSLFGSVYLFDGNNIYFANIDNGSVSFPLEIVTSGRGLTFLCNSPERAWFLSAFDNSIYVFDGGRSLRKWRRFNGFSSIVNGIYSVRDETLLLEAENEWIWMRDGIISSNDKTSTQLASTCMRLYDTEGGIYMGDNSNIWAYGYQYTSIPDLETTVTPVPAIESLDIQLPYYGFGDNKIGQFHRYVVAVWSENRTAAKITTTTYGFDQDERKGFTNLNPVQRVVNIQPRDYDDSGHFRFSVDPAAQRGIASSIRIQTDDLLSLYEVVLEYSDLGTFGTLAPNRRV